MKSTTTAICLAALFLLTAAPAEAATISGAFSMAGGLEPGQDFSMQDTVDVAPQSMVVLPGTIDGDFASYLAGGDTGTHKDIKYDSFVEIDDLWTITGTKDPMMFAGEFAFKLKTLSNDFESATQLVLSGTGTITHPDFDDTPFDWDATFQVMSMTGSFSASTQEVPEPSTVTLACFGLFALLACGPWRSTTWTDVRKGSR